MRALQWSFGLWRLWWWPCWWTTERKGLRLHYSPGSRLFPQPRCCPSRRCWRSLGGRRGAGEAAGGAKAAQAVEPDRPSTHMIRARTAAAAASAADTSCWAGTWGGQTCPPPAACKAPFRGRPGKARTQDEHGGGGVGSARARGSSTGDVPQRHRADGWKEATRGDATHRAFSSNLHAIQH